VRIGATTHVTEEQATHQRILESREAELWTRACEEYTPQ